MEITPPHLLHSEHLNVFGNVDAPILVVCDNVGERTFEQGGVMPPVLFNKFSALAYENGLADADFVFVLPCPCMPEAIIGAEKKENEFLKQHREEFREVVSRFPNVRMAITLGKIAAKQALERPVKITKVRGQLITDHAHPFPILPIYSPKHVHVRPENEGTWKSDFVVVRTMMENGYDPAVLAESVKRAEYEWCFDLSHLLANPPKAMAVDSESRGGQWYRGADIILAQITYKEHHALLVPLDLAWWNSFQSETGRPMGMRERQMLVAQLRQLLGRMGIPVSGHNFGSDVHKFRKLGITFDNWKHDTMQLLFVNDENMLSKDLAEGTRLHVARLAGYCVAPETRLLKADMTKMVAGDAVVGDELIGFEEYPKFKSRRSLGIATVESVERIVKACYKLTFLSGRELIISNNHQWLTVRGLHGGGMNKWKRTDDIRVGDKVKAFPWAEADMSRQGGYVAGLLDGEGWTQKTWRAGFAQRTGVILDTFLDYCKEKGIHLSACYPDKRKKKERPCVNVTFHGWRGFELLQTSLSPRLCSDRKWIGSKLPTIAGDGNFDVVVAKQYVGNREVMAIRTTTHTFVAEGLCSHNSDEFDKTVDKEHMELVSPEIMRPYAGGDTDACFSMTKTLVRLAMKDSRNYNCYTRIQMPALRMFPKMEEYGMTIDQPALRELGGVLAVQEKEWYDELISQVSPAVRRRHAEKGLAFSRADFTIDVLFSPKKEGGRGLVPLVFTKSTKKAENEDEKVPSTSAKDHLPYFSQDDAFVARLIEYQKLQKMRSTYVGQEGGILIPQRRVNAPEKFTPKKGFWQYLSEDSRIHPSFFLHRTVTGRTACLVGETPITVLDARGTVPIRDIRIGDWIWAYDDNLRPVPAQVSWQGMTMRRAKLVRVSYLTQGGRKVKTITCTPDHPFRLRNGEYVQAKDLLRGHRVLSLERSINHAGYRQVYATGQKVQLEHRMIIEGADAVDAIHHIDETKTNNSPDNIIPLTHQEHAGIHGWTPERILKMRRTAMRRPRRVSALKGKEHPHYYRVSKEWCLGVLRAHGGKPSAFRDVYGLDYECIMQKLADLGVDWKAERDQFNKRGERITDDLIAQARLAPRLCDASRILGVNFYKAKELLATDHNHIITKVEEIEETAAVYDITVPRFHNFIANGVCVHNSAYPNAQNFPKRGKIAKAFRKIFKCAPGWGFVEADLSQAELRIAAWMAHEPTMLRIYNAAGGDVHIATACTILGISVEQFMSWKNSEEPIPANLRYTSGECDTLGELFELKRYQAKAVNFGLIYGMGWKKLIVYAKTTYGVDFTETEAQEIRRKYFALYSRLEAWHDSMRDFVRTHGYVRALHGAVRHLPNIFSPDDYVKGECERQAINSPVQRFGSDLGLMGMIRFGRDCDWRVMQPMAFIHDAVIIHCRADFIPEVAGAMKFYLESNPLEQWFGITPPLPILADVKTTQTNLGEMEDFDTEAYEPEWYRGELDEAAA